MKPKLKTKTDYVRAHRKMWNEVIRILKRNEASSDGICDIKKEAVYKLWGHITLAGNCFGCQYTKDTGDGSCHSCMFKTDVDNSGSTYRCLNGLWAKIVDSKSTKRKIKLAVKIRDFPVKKE